MNGLADLREAGLSVRVEGDSLRVGPPSLVTPEIAEFIRTNKTRLVMQVEVEDHARLVETFPEPDAYTLPGRMVRAVVLAARTEADDAFARGDLVAFRAALKRWREAAGA